MVVINRIEARRGISAGSAPSVQVDNSIAEGLGQLSNAVGNVAQVEREVEFRRLEQQNRVAEFQTEQQFQRIEDDNALKFGEAQLAMPASGEGFYEGFNKTLITQYEAFLDTVPDALKPRFAELIATKKNAWENKAVAVEVDTRNAWYKTGVDDTIKAGQDKLLNDPSQFAATLMDTVRLIDASDLPAAEKEALKKNADAMLGAAVAERALRDDPAALAGQLGIPESRDAYYAAIRSAESSGNDQAANPLSTAYGRYQPIKSTWDDIVRRYPKSGLTYDGRGDPAQQEIFIRLFTEENAASLKAAGIADTNGNLYAAHFLGAGGAKIVLKAPDGAAMASVVDPEVITANPFLKGMTVGGFKAWAARKGGGNAPGFDGQPAPEYAGIALPDRLKLYDQALATVAQQQTASATLAAAAISQAKDQTALGITLGTVVSEQQILELGLPAGETNTLIKQLRTELGAVDEAQAWLQQWAAGTAPSVNPYNEADRALLSKAYDVLARTMPREQMPELAAQFAENTGIVPKAAVADVRQGLNSTNVADVTAAMEQASRLFGVAPRGLDAVEHGKELRDAALMYDELVNGQGLPATVAAQRLIDSRDPAKVQTATVLKERWRSAMSDTASTDPFFQLKDVTAAFDQMGDWEGAPSAGMTPSQQDTLLGDYVATAERAFMGPAAGDLNLARALALDEMKTKYGVTRVSGEPVVTLFPPENFFPPRAGGHTYIRDLALKLARETDPAASNVMLVPYNETTQNIRAGEPPVYLLNYKRADGVWDTHPQSFTIGAEELAEMAAIDTERRQLQFEIARETAALQQAAPPVPFLLSGVPGFTPQDTPSITEKRSRLVNLDQQQRQLLGTISPNVDTTSVPDLSLLYQQQLEANPMFGGVVQ